MITRRPLRERRIAARGLGFRALEWSGEPPPVLLLHATSFCAEAWGPAWAAAEREGGPRWTVAVDQRGHGGSDAPVAASDYAWTELAADALALADALCEERAAPRAVAVGHSSGATAALAAAGMRPERFAAVVAIEPVLFDPPRAPDLDSFAGSRTLADAARRRRNAFASAEEARARLRPRFPYAGMADEAFAAVLEGTLAAHEDGGVGLRCPGEREAWCYEGAASLDLWPLAARIEAPLLLVQGEHTALPALLRARLLAGRTRACVVSIPEATHFALLERPAEVGRAIGRFLAERVR